MAILVTNAVQVARFANALYGIKLGSTTNAAVNADIANIGLSATVNAYYDYSFGSKTSAEVAAIMLGNLGLTGNTAAAAYVEGQLNAAGSAKGVAVLNMLNAFSNLESDATFGAAATAWNATIVSAQAYTASNTADVAATATTTQTFTLTTGVDAPKLSTANDSLSGITGDATAANNSLNVGDSIVDASTTDADVLGLTIVGTTASAVATITNIETINLNNVAAGSQTFNAILTTGVKNINATVASAGHVQTVSNLGTLSTVVGLAGKGDLTVGYSATLSGTADEANLAINGAGTSAATRSAIDVSNSNAIESVKIAASGTSFVNLTGGTALNKITVTGSGNLTLQGNGAGLTGDATNNALTVDGSAATGKQSYTFGAGAIKVTGGSADDTFAFGTTLGSTDTIDGGAGNDTVSVDLNSAVQVNPALTNIEKLSAKFTAAGIFNASKATSLTSADIEVTNGTDVTLTNLVAGVQTVNFNKDGAADTAGAVSLSYASGAKAAVTINVGEIDTGTTSGAGNKGDAIALGGVALSNVGTLVLNSVRDTDNTAVVDNTLTSLDVGTATDVRVTTSDKATISTGNLTGASVTKLAVAADTGNATIGTFVGAALTDYTLTSANKATLTTGNFGTANNATTTSKLANYSVTTGSDTTVNLGTIDAATLSTSTAAAVSALKSVSYDLGAKATVTGIGAINAADEGAGAGGTNKGSGVAQLDSITFKLGADAVTNAITVGAISARSVTNASFTAADDATAGQTVGATLNIDESIGSLSIASGKNVTTTITIQGLDDNAATDLYNLAVGGITITGDGNAAIAGLSTGVKSIASIDATALKGTLEVAASTLSGSAGTTITIGEGGTAGNGVAGSNKADIINGGKGADTILGDAGADQITGGLGADVITGGAGADTIDLTEATSAADTLRYAESGAANVDSVTGFKAATDVISFTVSNTAFDFNADATAETLSTVGGTDVGAAGAATAVTVAVNAAVTAANGANLIFLSNTAATSFASAIGTGSVVDTANGNTAGLAATEGVAAVFYDANNGQAVFGYIVDSAANGTALTSADTFVEVVRVGMVSADYTASNVGSSFAFF